MSQVNATLSLYCNPDLVQDIKQGLALSEKKEVRNLLKTLHFHKILHYVSHLYLKPIIDSRYDERTDFIYVSNKFFEKMYSSNFYNIIKKALEEINVLQIDHRYSTGKYTKSYRLNPKYTSLKFKKYQIEKTSLIYKNQIKYRAASLNRSIYGNKSLHHPAYIKVEGQLHKLIINEEAAKQYLLEKLKYQMNNPTKIKKKSYSEYKDISKKRKNTILLGFQQDINDLLGYSYQFTSKHTLNRLKKLIDTHLSNTIAIDMIVDRNFFFEVDKNGRLHHNLTCLSKDLRVFIDMGGDSIKGADIVNSQPFFLALILIKKYGDNMPEDMMDYVASCIDGNIYERMMELSGKNNRDIFKKNMFSMYFSEVKDMRGAASLVFEQYFPSVFRFIVKVKKQYGYKQFANLLQKTESDAMFASASACFAEGIKVISLHDSLYSAPQHKARVEEIISNTILEKYGVYPKIKVD